MRRLLLLTICCLLAGPAYAQSSKELKAGRQRGWTERQVHRWLDYLGAQQQVRSPGAADCPDFTTRRDVIMNGNKITTQITNFGSISSPGNTITDIVWNGLGYGYEFGPFVAAEVVDEGHRDPQSVPQRDAAGNVVRDAAGDTVWVMHIVSDGLVSNGGERSPDGAEYWGWQPIPCAQPVGSFAGLQVVNPTSDRIPTNDAPDANLDGKPDSWPDEWYNENLKAYVWPGALQQGTSNADKESLYFINDYNNREFAYQPFPAEPARRGLGLEVETRIYQWTNPLAEDALFLIYKITNKSDRDLERVLFGMWGDPHIGGPSDYFDDLAFFDRDLNMVFAWDADGRSAVAGRAPGYFGYKFLESPGVDYDGIDNDGDGLVDESWTDGLDNDGDWSAERDDVGLDGIPGTGDAGENDGRPTAGDLFDITKPGEPNFEFTDIDESDQIGLTSFASPPFAGNRIDNDERLWSFVQPGSFDEIPRDPGDYVFIYGSGDFRLRAGETKRFSIALIVGENFEDLVLNAQTVQQIYDAGYRFAKPPDKPVVRAVPGDQKVTLYWDSRAERSVDPLSGANDFEGYVLYRSTDPQFSDQQTITDINGSRFLYRPLTNTFGVEAKFDLQNGIRGIASVPYPRRGVAYDLGDDTGLFHTYVDSNNVVNGQRYFYTVVAYDHGSTALDIPPTETSKTITYDPQTDQYIFDLNTASVIPRPRVAGYVPPGLVEETGLAHVQGHGTGDVEVVVVDELAVQDENPFRIRFEQIEGRTAYTVVDERFVSLEVSLGAGKAAPLGYAHVVPETFALAAGGQTYQPGVDYALDAATGRVEPLPGGALGSEVRATATFQHAPVYQSTLLAGEENNPIFDGLQVFVQDETLGLDAGQTGWTQGGRGLAYDAGVATAGPGRRPQPFDYRITFADEPVATGFLNNLPQPFQVVNETRANQPLLVFSPDLVQDARRPGGEVIDGVVDSTGVWNVGDPIIFLEEIDGAQIATWQVQLSDPQRTGARPGGGDVFFLKTTRPFTSQDVFTFTTRAARTEPERVREALRNIYVVPNPYVATNELEPRNPVSNTERGERRLYFANVPRQCTIRIYTLAGELVDELVHDSTLDDGKAFWDLRTRDNMNIAYGLYLYHVESEEGTFIGKFAVIK